MRRHKHKSYSVGQTLFRVTLFENEWRLETATVISVDLNGNEKIKIAGSQQVNENGYLTFRHESEEIVFLRFQERPWWTSAIAAAKRILHQECRIVNGTWDSEARKENLSRLPHLISIARLVEKLKQSDGD